MSDLSDTSEVDALQIRVAWLEREVERLENVARLKSAAQRSVLSTVIMNIDVARDNMRMGLCASALPLVTAALLQLRKMVGDE